MRSSSRSSAAAALGLLLAACQAGAPALPPDTTGVTATRTVTLADFSAADAALDCAAIQAQRRQVAETMQAAQARVAADRTANQVGGYFLGVLYFAPYAAARGSTHPQKAELDQLYGRQDTLLKLANFRRCAATD